MSILGRLQHAVIGHKWRNSEPPYVFVAPLLLFRIYRGMEKENRRVSGQSLFFLEGWIKYPMHNAVQFAASYFPRFATKEDQYGVITSFLRVLDDVCITPVCQP